jgi:outer membrane lipoprotein
MNANFSLMPSPCLYKVGIMLLTFFILGGCASNIPEQIKKDSASQITPDEARQQGKIFSGQSVRWGGDVISIDNKAGFTQITILARTLDVDGQPISNGKNQGRFIAQIDRFLEPSQYPAGREITVFGTYDKNISKMIGEYNYQHPVVKVTTFYLWPEPIPYEPDYWYDPWDRWGPWGGWYSHPYYHRY